MSTITVEVVCALPGRQEIKAVQLAANASVREAVSASRLPELFPDIDLDSAKVGIFGRVVSMNATLRDGDRVEIYRPLVSDPKETRRRRAARQKRR